VAKPQEFKVRKKTKAEAAELLYLQVFGKNLTPDQRDRIFRSMHQGDARLPPAVGLPVATPPVAPVGLPVVPVAPPVAPVAPPIPELMVVSDIEMDLEENLAIQLQGANEQAFVENTFTDGVQTEAVVIAENASQIYENPEYAEAKSREANSARRMMAIRARGFNNEGSKLQDLLVGENISQTYNPHFARLGPNIQINSFRSSNGEGSSTSGHVTQNLRVASAAIVKGASEGASAAIGMGAKGASAAIGMGVKVSAAIGKGASEGASAAIGMGAKAAIGMGAKVSAAIGKGAKAAIGMVKGAGERNYPRTMREIAEQDMEYRIAKRREIADRNMEDRIAKRDMEYGRAAVEESKNSVAHYGPYYNDDADDETPGPVRKPVTAVQVQKERFEQRVYNEQLPPEQVQEQRPTQVVRRRPVQVPLRRSARVPNQRVAPQDMSMLIGSSTSEDQSFFTATGPTAKKTKKKDKSYKRK
jgi:hypothetical protein